MRKSFADIKGVASGYNRQIAVNFDIGRWHFSKNSGDLASEIFSQRLRGF
jgi:hypothetical protein